jgi:alkylation response protein AidB-like acyl-CoA dehydrogenase
MYTDERRGTFPELETARSLVPDIRAAQSQISDDRELPAQLINKITSKGMLRLLLPAAMGGSELSLPKFMRCIEVVAQADGSTGWCVSQGGVYPNVADYMPAETAQAIWDGQPHAVVATGTPTGSTARQVDGGYVLAGRWRFASGSRHATWLAAMSPIVDDQGTAVGFGMFLVPKELINLGDGWNVRGLRGTGSREYTLDNLHVPAPRCLMGNVFKEHCGVATRLPSQLLFASGFGSVGLGIARSAIDTLMEIIAGKTPVFTNRRLLDDDLVQTGLAEAEALWGSSRAFLHDVAEACAYERATHGAPSGAIRARLRLAATNAIRQSGQIVRKAYELAGSDAIFEDHPLQRCFQDIHAVTQQVQGRPAHFRTVGRVLLGLEPDNAVL